MTKDDRVTPAVLGFTFIPKDHPASAGHLKHTGKNYYLKFESVPYGYVWRWESSANNVLFCTAQVCVPINFSQKKRLTVGMVRDDLVTHNERGFYSVLILYIESKLREI